MRDGVRWVLRCGFAGLLLLGDPAARAAEPGTPGAGFGPWLAQTRDLGPSDRRSAEQAGRKATFIPLGFSKDGWFAFLSGPSGAEEPPQAAELVNIRCEDTPCLRDTPEDAQDRCYCLFGAGPDELRRRRIAPFAGPPRQGVFPAAFGQDVLDVELVLVERGLPPVALTPGQAPAPEFPRTDVVLTSTRMGRKRVGSIDHNHAGLVFGSAYPLGWIQSPHERRVVILVGAVQPPATLTVQAFRASLDRGFAR